MADKPGNHAHTDQPKMPRKQYERELATLQLELVKMLHWIRESGHRLVVIFEGRDAAGKGGTIKRVSRAAQPPFLSRRRAAGSDRAGADAVVLPALRQGAARRGRDDLVRPVLVQPRRSRARDGLLHRRGVLGVSAHGRRSSSGCSLEVGHPG